MATVSGGSQTTSTFPLWIWRAEALILYLDAAGIYVSTGARAQCIVGPKPCFLALGMPYEVAHGSIRFSLGRPQPSEISYMY